MRAASSPGHKDDQDCSDDDEESTTQARGYCHMNENGSNNTFTINIFGSDITIDQRPDATNLGHGAVVWDAAVVFCKYLEHNSSVYSTAFLKGNYNFIRISINLT